MRCKKHMISGLVIGFAMVLYFIPHSTTLVGCASYLSQAYVIDSFTLTGIEGSYGCNDIRSGYGHISILILISVTIFLAYDYVANRTSRSLTYFVQGFGIVLLLSGLIFIVTAPFGPHATLIPFIGGENVTTGDINTTIEPFGNDSVRIQIDGNNPHNQYLTVSTVNEWDVDEVGGIVNKTRLVRNSNSNLDVDTNSSETVNVGDGDLIVVHFGSEYSYNEVYRYSDGRIIKVF